jgi:hypothetical protein
MLLAARRFSRLPVAPSAAHLRPPLARTADLAAHRALSILSKYNARRDAHNNESYNQTKQRLQALREKREADYALSARVQQTEEWQLLEADIAVAKEHIRRQHFGRKTSKEPKRISDECNVEIARTRHAIRHRHFRLWEQRGLPIAKLYPSDNEGSVYPIKTPTAETVEEPHWAQ